jgi:hypothetical protein
MKAHLKDTTASGQTYSCSICDKVFSRADTRKRHEAAHSYSLTCEVCLPVAPPLAPLLQICLRYRTLVSGSSGNTSGPTGFYMGILGGGDTVHRCFVTGPGLGATGHFIFSNWKERPPCSARNATSSIQRRTETCYVI